MFLRYINVTLSERQEIYSIQQCHIIYRKYQSLFICFRQSEVLKLLELPDHILVLILRNIPLEVLLQNVTVTCKRLHHIVEEVSLLWEDFEFDFPISISENNLPHIFRHSSGFRQFVIPGTTYNCFSPSIDLHFTLGFVRSSSLYSLDISGSPVSTLCFLSYLPNIEILNVSDCTNLTDTDIKAVTVCKKLDHLYLSNLNISSSTVVQICDYLDLIVLDVTSDRMLISDCERILYNMHSLLFLYKKCFH